MLHMQYYDYINHICNIWWIGERKYFLVRMNDVNNITLIMVVIITHMKWTDRLLFDLKL